ncbi:MAG: 6-bladed beta-propeller [Balneolaceae bacterium]
MTPNNPTLLLLPLLLMLLLALASCKPEEGVPEAYSISLDDIEFDFNRLVKRATIYPLETTTHSLMQGIDRVYRTEDEFIIYDTMARQALIFDTLGTHRLTIQNIGDGPGEYRYLTDVLYDPQGERLGFARSETGELLWYDKQGRYLHADHMSISSFYLSRAIIHNERIYHYSANPKANPDHDQVHVTSLDLSEIYQSHFRTNTEELSGRNFQTFTVLDGEVYFFLPYSTELHRIEEGEASDVFRFDFMEWTAPEDLLREFLDEKNFNRRIELNQRMSPYVSVRNVYPLNDRRVLIPFTHMRQPHVAVVSLDTGEASVHHPRLVATNISNVVATIPDENIFYYSISPTSVAWWLSQGEDVSGIGNIERAKQILAENDPEQLNPWIIRVEF